MAFAFRLAVSFVALTIAACASSPVTLIVLPPPPSSAPTDQPSTMTVLLRDVTLPGYLDAYPVVIGRKENALIVSEHAEWAERLSPGVERVLRDALAQRLGESHVLISGDHRAVNADLSIEFLSLDPRDGALQLDARWLLSCRAAGTSLRGRIRLQVVLSAATPAAVAAGTTEALTGLADGLAPKLRCQVP